MGTFFYIISRPSMIEFKCPYCNITQSINWRDLNVPEYWGDPWDDVECPTCGGIVELGDWDYD